MPTRLAKYQKISGFFLIPLLLIGSISYQPTHSNSVCPGNHKRKNFRADKTEIADISIQTYTSSRNNNFTLIGRWADGPCCAVDVEDNIACFGNRRYLEIVDFSDPDSPVELKKMQFPYPVGDIVLDGQLLYLLSGYFRIIDISDPVNPNELGACENSPPGWYLWSNFAISGNYAYLAYDNDGLWILDISDHENPHIEEFYELEGACDIAISGDYAYVAAGSTFLHILDISDPPNPKEVSRFDTQDGPIEVAVYEQYILIASGCSGVWVLDVSDPENPNPVGSYGIGDYPMGIEVMGDYAFVEDQSGLCVVEISDPSNPLNLGYFDTYGEVEDVAVNNGEAYVADAGFGLRVVDVSDPVSPQEIGSYYTGACVEDVTILNNYAYLGDGGAGMRVIDISDPSDPQAAARFISGGYVENVAVSSTRAYVADNRFGLYILDITLLTTPVQLGFYSSGGLFDVAVNGNYAYAAESWSGVLILDISNPGDLQVTARYHPGGHHYITEIAFYNNHIYIDNADGNIEIIDVTDPANPQKVATCEAENPQGVTFQGNYAYVLDDGLRILDVSDPTNPEETAFLRPLESWGHCDWYGIDVKDGHAFLACGVKGIMAVDISDPANPSWAGYYDTEGMARGIFAEGDTLYVADGYEGLTILEFQEASYVENPSNSDKPSCFRLYQNTPNPFNSSTTIRYTVKTPSRVVLEVFDTQGREIATLVDADHTPGHYETVFNPSHLQSGLYFYRIQMEDFQDTKKMVVLK